MKRTELMVWEGVNGLRAGRISPHRPEAESCRVIEDRWLCMGNALMRFAPIPTINSVLSNAADLRLQSCYVVGVPMEKRSPITEPVVASEHPNLNEGCEPNQGSTLGTPPARGPAVVESKTNLNLNSNDAG
jgi:hypothetical protein